MTGTTFYTTSDRTTGTHTSSLNLIQTSVNVAPPEARTKYIEVPHRNGTLDVSDFLGSVSYSDREITWEFTVKPGETYTQVRAAVEQLHGKRLYIVLDEEPSLMYCGRVTVNSYNRDKTLRRITMSATCDPEAAAI